MKILQTIKSGKLLPIDEYFSLTNDFFCKISILGKKHSLLLFKDGFRAKNKQTTFYTI